MSNGLLEEIATAAINMKPGATRDLKWRITPFTDLWICPQTELDSHGRGYMTWIVRWVSTTGGGLEGIHCEHPVILLAAVAEILDRAGVLPDGRR